MWLLSTGLYSGSHDPDSHLAIAMTTGNWGGAAALHWYAIPANPLAPLSAEGWAMPYEIVLQGFETQHDSAWRVSPPRLPSFLVLHTEAASAS